MLSVFTRPPCPQPTLSFGALPEFGTPEYFDLSDQMIAEALVGKSDTFTRLGKGEEGDVLGNFPEVLNMLTQRQRAFEAISGDAATLHTGSAKNAASAQASGSQVGIYLNDLKNRVGQLLGLPHDSDFAVVKEQAAEARDRNPLTRTLGDALAKVFSFLPS